MIALKDVSLKKMKVHLDDVFVPGGNGLNLLRDKALQFQDERCLNLETLTSEKAFMRRVSLDVVFMESLKSRQTVTEHAGTVGRRGEHLAWFLSKKAQTKAVVKAGWDH